MPGTNAANRKRINTQKVHRMGARHLAKKKSMQVMSKERIINEAMTPHHVKMLMSNPKANVQVSARKMKKLQQQLRREQELLISKGLATAEVHMTDCDNEADHLDSARPERTRNTTALGTTLGSQ